MGSGAVIVGCSVFCVILITSCVLFACSFSIVELDEYGIIFDNNKQKVESEPHDSGRYFTGLGRKFYLYPRSYQRVQFSNSKNSQGDPLSIWTKDGLSVWLDISFHFNLNKEKLKDLHFEYGDNWYASVVRIATTTIKDKSTQKTTRNFFENREQIAEDYQEELDRRLKTYTKDCVQLKTFQMRSITFDSAYEASIVKKLTDEQQALTVEITKEIQEIQKETELINVKAENQVKIIYATAEAEGNKEIENAKATGFKNHITATVEAYKDLFDKFNTKIPGSQNSDKFIDADKKLQYIYVSELGELDSDKSSVYMGLDQPYIKS